MSVESEVRELRADFAEFAKQVAVLTEVLRGEARLTEADRAATKERLPLLLDALEDGLLQKLHGKYKDSIKDATAQVGTTVHGRMSETERHVESLLAGLGVEMSHRLDVIERRLEENSAAKKSPVAFAAESIKQVEDALKKKLDESLVPHAAVETGQLGDVIARLGTLHEILVKLSETDVSIGPKGTTLSARAMKIVLRYLLPLVIGSGGAAAVHKMKSDAVQAEHVLHERPPARELPPAHRVE